MVWTKHEYDKIPGTYVFDGKRANPAYNLNKLLFSFNEEKNRAEFDQDPAAYCDKMGVAGEQKEAILNHDFLGMLNMGANIYYMAKMAIPRGVSVQDAGAAFQGITTEEFMNNLLDKGKDIVKKVAGREGYWNG
jgi:protocatechuate 4,5-dioxygenase alpha chain